MMIQMHARQHIMMIQTHGDIIMMIQMHGNIIMMIQMHGEIICN